MTGEAWVRLYDTNPKRVQPYMDYDPPTRPGYCTTCQPLADRDHTNERRFAWQLADLNDRVRADNERLEAEMRVLRDANAALRRHIDGGAT